jgi:antitoxin ParD1/3/4
VGKIAGNKTFESLGFESFDANSSIKCMIISYYWCSTIEAPAVGTVRKTITLTDQQDDWIKALVEAGQYTNDSEYIRDLIRREQERDAEISAVRAALIEGEKSGKPKRIDASAFKRKMRRVHA